MGRNKKLQEQKNLETQFFDAFQSLPVDFNVVIEQAITIRTVLETKARARSGMALIQVRPILDDLDAWIANLRQMSLTNMGAITSAANLWDSLQQ